MSLAFRRFLYTTFILAFLIITPLLILYANGYTFGANGRAIVKTGMLILKTEPSGAMIYLNDKPQQTFLDNLLKVNNFLYTPAKIKGLIPGEYNIKLELDGYWTWQKKLVVEPGRSTFAENIILFRKGLPIQIANGQINKIFPSPDAKSVIYFDNESIAFADLSTDETIKLLNLDQGTNHNTRWSPDSRNFIVDNIAYRVDGLNDPIDLDKQLNVGATSFKFNLDQSDIIYYKDKDNSLNLYNLTNKSNFLVLQGKSISGDYLIKGDFVFAVTGNGNSYKLDIHKISSNSLFRSIDLPGYANYIFINEGNSLTNLYDQEHQILYLIDPFSSYLPLKDTLSNVKNASWIDGDRLIYNNDHEIWIYNLSSNQRTLLNRIGQKIDKVSWHPSNNYVIYSTGNDINTLELDQRTGQNITELIRLEMVSSAFISQDGETLYFISSIGKQKGLYKLNIQ